MGARARAIAGFAFAAAVLFGAGAGFDAGVMDAVLRPLHGAPALGASVVDGGVAFALAAPNAQAVELCLFDTAGHTEIQRLQMPTAVVIPYCYR